MIYNGNKSIPVATDVEITDDSSYVSIPNTPIEIPSIDSEGQNKTLSELNAGYYNVLKFNGEDILVNSEEINKSAEVINNISNIEEQVEIPNTIIEIPSVGKKETINSGLDSGYYNQAVFNGKGTSSIKPEIIVTSSEESYEDYIEIPHTEVLIPGNESEDSIDTSNDSRFNKGFYNVAKFDKYIEEFNQTSDSIEPTTTPSGFDSQSGGLETLESGEIGVSVPTVIENKVISEFDKGIYNGLVFNGEGKGSEQLSQESVKPIIIDDSVSSNEEEINKVPDVFVDIPTIEAESTVNSEWNSGHFNLMMYEGGIPSQIETVAPVIDTIKPNDGQGEESIPSGQESVKPVEDIPNQDGEIPEIEVSIVSEESISSEFDSGNYNVMIFDGKNKSLVTLPTKEEIIQGQGSATIINSDNSGEYITVSPSGDTIISESSYVVYSSDFNAGLYNVMAFNSHTSIDSEGIIESEIVNVLPVSNDSVNSNLEDGEIPVTRVKVPTVDSNESVDANFDSGYYNVMKFDGTKIVPQIDKYSTLSSEEQENIKEEDSIPSTPITVPSVVIYSEFNYGKYNDLVLNGDREIPYSLDSYYPVAEDIVIQPTQGSGNDTNNSGDDIIVIPETSITIPSYY